MLPVRDRRSRRYQVMTPSVGREPAGRQRSKPDYRGVPSVAFTIPPIVAVGPIEVHARKQGLKFRIQVQKAPDWFTARQAAELLRCAFAGREDNPNKGSRRGHRGRARKPYRRTMPPCHLRLTQADQTLQPRFHTAYTRSGPSHVKAASLRASNAIAMSEAPPNTMSIPTRRPSAQNGRMGHSKCFGLALVRPGQATHRSSRAWLPRYVRDRKLDLDINSLAPPCRQFQPRRDRHGRMDIRND